MEIEEMHGLRKALERKLCVAAWQVVNEFQRDTGLRVESVGIDLANVQTVSEPGPGMSFVIGAHLNVRL